MLDFHLINLKVRQSKILLRDWQPKGKLTAPSSINRELDL
jgi:hypothetical protein